MMYENGQGVPQDKAEAARWYSEAAKQGEFNGEILLKVMNRPSGD
jgi:TPR repeat protein